MSKIQDTLGEIRDAEKKVDGILEKARQEATKIEQSAAAEIAEMKKTADDKIKSKVKTADKGGKSTTQAAVSFKEVDKKKIETATALVMKQFRKQYMGAK